MMAFLVWLVLAHGSSQELVVASPRIDAILGDGAGGGDSLDVEVVPFEPAAAARKVRRVPVTKAMRQACGLESGPDNDDGPSTPAGAVNAGDLVVVGFKGWARRGLSYCILDKAGGVIEQGTSRAGVYVQGNNIMVFESRPEDALRQGILRSDRDPSPGEPVFMTYKSGSMTHDREPGPHQFVRVSETEVVPVMAASGGQEVTLEPAGEDAWRLWRWAPLLEGNCYIQRIQRKGAEVRLQPDKDQTLTGGCAELRPGYKAAHATPERPAELQLISPAIDAILADPQAPRGSHGLVAVAFEPAPGSRKVDLFVVEPAMGNACGIDVKDPTWSLVAVKQGSLVVLGAKARTDGSPGLSYCVLRRGAVIERGVSALGVYVQMEYVMVFTWAHENPQQLSWNRGPSTETLKPILLPRLAAAMERRTPFVRVFGAKVVPVLRATGGGELTLSRTGEDSWRLSRWGAPPPTDDCDIQATRRDDLLAYFLYVQPFKDKTGTESCMESSMRVRRQEP